VFERDRSWADRHASSLARRSQRSRAPRRRGWGEASWGTSAKWTLVAVLCGAACAKGNGDDDKKVVVPSLRRTRAIPATIHRLMRAYLTASRRWPAGEGRVRHARAVGRSQT